jgi:hypothetical protein
MEKRNLLKTGATDIPAISGGLEKTCEPIAPNCKQIYLNEMFLISG